MATVATTTAGRIEVVEWPPAGEEETHVCAADITAGTFVRQNASGKWEQALSTSAAAVLGARLATRTAKTGEALTAIRSGTVAGYTITQAYNASLYVNDTGVLGDAAGTASVIAGRVIAGYAGGRENANDKLLSLDLPL